MVRYLKVFKKHSLLKKSSKYYFNMLKCGIVKSGNVRFIGGGDYMLNRILVYFGSESEAKSLLDYAEVLQRKYDVEVDGIYIKDVRKYEVLPPSIEGFLVDNSSSSYLLQEWEKAEKDHIDFIERNFKERFKGENFIVEDGEVDQIIFKKMRGYDLLVAGKSQRVSSNLKLILKNHYKPVLIVPKNSGFEFEKILVSDDRSERLNRSLFYFMNIFSNVKNYDILSVNIDENDLELNRYFLDTEKNVKYIRRQGEDEVGVIVEESKKYDLLIMGDMKYPYTIEKLTRHIGAKLLENLEIPIFIA
jgi:hypothetical protein